jgi:hypothetical protein
MSAKFFLNVPTAIIPMIPRDIFVLLWFTEFQSLTTIPLTDSPSACSPAQKMSQKNVIFDHFWRFF